MDWQNIILIIFQILYIVTLIGVITVIISENRNPQKTISWILVLAFLPVLGLIFYFVFGRNHRKVRRINKKIHKGLEGISAPDFNYRIQDEPADEHIKLKRLLVNIDSAPVLGGNRVDLLTSGKDKFEQLFIDIRNAREHIHILYYKIGNDEVGNRLKDLLIEKVKEGVVVRLIYDDVGSLHTRSCFFRDMQKAGVQVACYLPIRFPYFARRVNYRNHRKIVVIDGKIGYTGGINVEDCYIRGVKWGNWCDLAVRIQGNGVYGLQYVFLKDWYYSRKESIKSFVYFPEMPRLGDIPMQVVSSSPMDTFENLAEGFFQAVCAAQKSIYIQTPYFIPSDELLKAMQNAALSGVKVSLMIPRKSDNFLVDAATYSSVRTLLTHDIDVYLYTAGFLHSKLIVVDDSLTVVGSANMDIRSFELNFETSAFIYDAETAKKAKQVFERDIRNSERVDLKKWNKRPRVRQYFESLMRLLTPLI